MSWQLSNPAHSHRGSPADEGSARPAARTRRAAGWLRAAANSQPAAWAAGGVLAAAALGQAWLQGLPVVSPLGAAVVLATLPLAWSRSRPAVASYLMTLGAASYAFIVERGSFVDHTTLDDYMELYRTGQVVLLAPVAGGLIGLYLLFRHSGLRIRWLVLVVTGGLLGQVVGTEEDLAGLAVLTIVVGIVALDAAQTRGELHRERAAAMARSVADQRQEAVAAERSRIARELHDLVAHSVSVIAVQAELLPPTIPDLPDQAQAGFQRIAGSARSAMTELRQMLDVLRQEATDADLAPLPTLAQLSELADQHRAAGGSVELRTHGQPRRLPALVELSAYRVVQEALTNIRKHAPGAHAQVDLASAPDRLTIQVTDDGPATAITRPDSNGMTVGHGLVGMRERVSMLGGRLRTGPGSAGGFEVVAELPVAPDLGAQPQGPGSAPEPGA